MTSRTISACGVCAVRRAGQSHHYRALVTHPLFGYRVNYRRVLDIQARLLARVVAGELPSYPGFNSGEMACEDLNAPKSWIFWIGCACAVRS